MTGITYLEFDHLIPEVRREFRAFHAKDNPQLYDDQDFELVQTDDFVVRRFLIHQNGNVVEALNMMVVALKWRKEMDFRHIPANYFPDEMYRIGGMFRYAADQEGHPTLYIRLKCVRKVPEIQDLVKKFAAFMIYQLDQEAQGRGWVLVFDFLGAGFQQCDLDMAKFMITCIKTYFPTGLAYALAVDFPWILRTFWNLVKGLVPANRRNLMKFASAAELKNYISPEMLPKYLGGTCTRPCSGPTLVPEGSPSCVDFGVKELGMPREQCEKLFAAFELLLEDS